MLSLKFRHTQKSIHKSLAHSMHGFYPTPPVLPPNKEHLLIMAVVNLEMVGGGVHL